MKFIQFRLRKEDGTPVTRAELQLAATLKNGESWRSKTLDAGDTGDIRLELANRLHQRVDWSRLEPTVTRGDRPLEIVAIKGPLDNSDGSVIDVVVGDPIDFPVDPVEPQGQLTWVRIVLALFHPKRRPAAGVRLAVSYERPGGNTWQSDPLVSDDQGMAELSIPLPAGESIDWERVGYEFSFRGQPLEVATHEVDPIGLGYSVNLLLRRATSTLPQADPDDGKWRVRGRLTTATGEPVKGTVSAAAISLSGEQAIGEAKLDDNGRYEIAYEWQPKCPPDLQVTARARNKVLALSPIYFSVGKSVRIDLVTGNEEYAGATEFQQTEKRVLKCNADFKPEDIGVRELDYLLGKSGLPRDVVNHYVVARNLATLSDVPAAVYYGLFRAGLPASVQGLTMQKPAVLENALASSTARNIIDRQYAGYGKELRDGLRQLSVDGALKGSEAPGAGMGRTGLGDLLGVVRVPKRAQETLVQRYLAHDGDDASFWQALESDQALKRHAGRVKLSLQAGALASYHLPTVAALAGVLGSGGEVRDLASWQEADWTRFAKGLDSAPADSDAGNEAEALRRHVEDMQRTVKRAFAREHTTANIRRSEVFADPGLQRFLKDHPDFDYGHGVVSTVLDGVDLSGDDRVGLETTLKGIQRLYRVAPADRKFDVIEPLYADGLVSARDVVRLGRTQFVERYAGAIGGRSVAGRVFDDAGAVTAVSTNLLAGYSDLQGGPQIYAISGGVEAAQTAGELAVPSYRDLFGTQSYCECEHCSSVYGPAAYLVDLLEYLGRSLVTKEIGGAYVMIRKEGSRVHKTGLDVLFSRRPDLGDIRLDCKNTNTLIPYIDLVNEIFERTIAGETDSTAYQTTWTEAELKANPEHILAAAYDTLAETPFPLALPFRLWNVEADHYLAHMEVPRWQLMDKVLQTPRATAADFHRVCNGHLGLTGADVDILVKPARNLAVAGERWGYANTGWRSDLAKVPEFLSRSGLAYDGLRQLLQVEFINAAEQVGVDFSEAESVCDIEGAVLRPIEDGKFENRPLRRETFEGFQQFLRLKDKTGWSIWQLGRVLDGLRATRIEPAVISQLSVLERLAGRFDLDLLELAAWWADLDTAVDETDPDHRSFYETQFQNQAVLNPPNEAFALDPADRSRLAVEAGGGASIAEHLPSIAAALQISESEAGLLATTLLDGAGGVDDSLTLANLSQLYRIVSLCRALKIDIDDYLIAVRLFGDDLWSARQPRAVLDFADTVAEIQASAFSLSELGYLLLHEDESVAREQIPAETIAGLLIDIQRAVRDVWAQYELTSAPLVDQVADRLAEYFDESETGEIVELVGQAEPRSVEDNEYLEQALAFLSPVALAEAVDQSLAAEVRYRSVLDLLNRYGRDTRSVLAVAQILADPWGLELSVAETLLTEVVARADGSGEFVIAAFLDPLYIQSGREKLAAAVDAEFLQGAIDIIEDRSSMSAADQEAFVATHFDFLDVDEATARLLGGDALDDTLDRYRFVTDPLDASAFEVSETVFAEQFTSVRRLHKSAVVISKFAITHTELPVLNSHAGDFELLAPAVFPFAALEQNTAGFAQWQNLGRLLAMRPLFDGADTDLFVLLEKIANPNLIDVTSVNTEIDELITAGAWNEADRLLLAWLYELAAATGWQFSELAYIAGDDMLRLTLAGLRETASLVYLRDVIELASKLGTKAAQLAAWAALDLSPEDAANARLAARARYALPQWYELAPELRNPLRERQRDALTAYMLYQGGFDSTVALYNHYLIDSQMSACMNTSRLKLALSSVQLFLQRCLLNLEPEFVEVASPEEWDWRKNYRVWEANRKVFLHPENWIEPDLRLSKSQLFDAAQSVLLQSEVTQEVAEQSLLTYLERLDEVSNIEVVGSYHEQREAEDGVEAVDRLHVIGRTRGVPRKYFYRLRDGRNWLPWQEVDAEIEADQVLPLVIDRRLHLIWPGFIEKQMAGTDYFDAADQQAQIDTYIDTTSTYDDYLNYLLHYEIPEFGFTVSLYSLGYGSVEEYAEILGDTVDEAISVLVNAGADSWTEYSADLRQQAEENLAKTFNYFEIRCFISEYKNGKWAPARQSEGFVQSDLHRSAVALLHGNLPPAVPQDFHFYTKTRDDVVTVECVQSLRYTDGTTYHFDEGRFEYNILSKEILAFESQDDIGWLELLLGLFGIVGHRGITAPSGTSVSANAYIEDTEPRFEIPEIVEGASTNYVSLLQSTPGTFRVPIQHQHEQFAADDLFFYGDDKRSYLVSPGSAPIQSAAGRPIELDTYLGSSVPGLGIYESLAAPAVGAAQPLEAPVLEGIDIAEPVVAGRSLLSARAITDTSPVAEALTNEIAAYEVTSVGQFYPLTRTGYRFESFYHPYVGDLIRTVNGEGAEAALSKALQEAREDYFEASYAPSEHVTSGYPVRSFSFTDTNAYGFYNWEFFFHLPLLIGSRLSRNQQFEQAQKWLHHIFDPTSRASGNGAQRFWQFKPFFDLYENEVGHPSDSIYDMLNALAADPGEADATTLALKEQTEQQIEVWLKNPFDPHAIAALRPVAYMKAVVMKYLDNLIAWGDHLYQQFTIESINEATQHYILAYQILGDRPLALPAPEVTPVSYNELGEVDAFSNAVAEIETLVNLSTPQGAASESVSPLYFCIPSNPNLLGYWDTVEDRLFKIRHCMTIDGVVQQLPLFQPPIDPGLLVRARASGVDIGAALTSLSTPAPHYRFSHLLQKAVYYCNVVQGLGSQLLSVLEKRDAEGLSLIRAEHEQGLLQASTEIRNLQVDEARQNVAALEKARELTQERIDYYANLEKRSEKEQSANRKLSRGEDKRAKSAAAERNSSRVNLFPNLSISVGLAPKFGITLGTAYGGSNAGAAESAKASRFRSESAEASYEASKLGTDAQHDRRWEEWKFQERLAKKELQQVEKQLIAAEIQLQLAEKNRDNHQLQLDQTREVVEYMVNKFTNEQLYGWLVSQISSIYFQSYQLAYDLAKRCEKAYQRESGEYGASFVAYGYWDSLKKGILSGERLHHDLQRMEVEHLNNNRREYELTKSISLAQLDPAALIALRETGECFIEIPESAFDFDYPGHYFRRIKSLSVTIPAITGPYTSLSSTLTLHSDRVRITPESGDEEDKFRWNLGAVESIATSSAQSDSGLFTLDFRDERYLPFEGAGVISTWKLKLNRPELAQFDLSTINDVVVQFGYTARDGGDAFRDEVEARLMAELDTLFESGASIQNLLSLKRDMGDEWARLASLDGDEPYRLMLELGVDDFPYYVRARGVRVTDLKLVVTDEVDTATWGAVELPNIADGESNRPYSVNLSDDPLLDSASAYFELALPVGDAPAVIEIDLPKELVGAIGGSVDDAHFVLSYEIMAADVD